jgi:Zn-dependent M28 family amino/carboxypeptidase
MINLDMVGRMKDNRVIVGGVDTGKEFRELISQAGQGLQIEMRPGVGRSDHVSFYNQGIPALHFFTGSHSDYHRPSDDWEKLDIEGMVKVSDLVLRLAKELAGAREPITFVRSASSPARPSPTSPRPAPDP